MVGIHFDTFEIEFNQFTCLLQFGTMAIIRRQAYLPRQVDMLTGIST